MVDTSRDSSDGSADQERGEDRVRSELERALETDESVLGEVFRLARQGFSDDQIRLARGNKRANFVWNYKRIISAVLEGDLPTAPTVAAFTANAFRSLLRNNEFSEATKLVLEQRLIPLDERAARASSSQEVAPDLASDDPVNSEAAELSGLLERVWRRDKGSKADLSNWISAQTGVPDAEIAISLAKGGTQQMLNRLGQSAVKRATALIMFLVESQDNAARSARYVLETIAGRTEAPVPTAPVIFAYPNHSGGWSVDHLVEIRRTPATRLLTDLFPMMETFAGPTQPGRETGTLPAGTQTWLLMTDSSSPYGDIDGVRYHFRTGIPNGRQVAVGDVVAVARLKSSRELDAGCVLGVGRIGRRIERGEDVTAYFDRYGAFASPIDLGELDDPRTNVNSIVRVDVSWMERLFQLGGFRGVLSLGVPFTALTLADLRQSISASSLVFRDDLLIRTLAALRAGKHIMFSGPPGTGKTSLALAIAEAAAARGLSSEPSLTTATADWTSVETVGAYRISPESDLRFHSGQVVSAIEGDQWLVVDELNRADIDKAIGQLFTVLSGQAVTLPFERDDLSDTSRSISLVPPHALEPDGTDAIRMTPNWRLLATLNDRDQDLLFDMSEALLRRFAVIEVGVPDESTWRELLGRYGSTGRASWDNAILELVTGPWLVERPVGPAVVLDCVRHLVERARLVDEVREDLDEGAALQEAIDLYVSPQLRMVASEAVTVDARSLLDADSLPEQAPSD